MKVYNDFINLYNDNKSNKVIIFLDKIDDIQLYKLFIKLCKLNHIYAIKYILDVTKFEVPYTALEVCCCNNHFSLFKFLLNYCHHIDISYDDNILFKICCEFGRMKFIRYFVRNYKSTIYNEELINNYAFIHCTRHLDLIKYLWCMFKPIIDIKTINTAINNSISDEEYDTIKYLNRIKTIYFIL